MKTNHNATFQRNKRNNFTCPKCGQSKPTWREAIMHQYSFNTESRCETLMDKRNRRNIYI